MVLTARGTLSHHSTLYGQFKRKKAQQIGISGDKGQYELVRNLKYEVFFAVVMVICDPFLIN